MDDEKEVNVNEDGQKDVSGDEAETKEKTQTFDEVLSNKEYQSEFDKRVTKALEKAKSKWETETEAKLKEAEKLAKMTANEKAEHERTKREEELSKREIELNKRELRAEAKSILLEKNLDVNLAEMLNYTDAESVKSSIESVEKAFNIAVESRVLEKLKGKTPQSSGGNAEKDPYLIGFDE